jgi:hypothetical protein
VDQYALACTAFELFTGAPPFHREPAAATIWAHMSQPPPALTARRPDFPPAVDHVLARAMAKAPGHRYRTCSEFGGALRHALGLAAYHEAADAVVPGAAPAVATWPSAAPQRPRADTSRSVVRRWQRDWTAWTLILAAPFVIAAALFATLGPVADDIGASVFAVMLLAVPAALIARLARWLRRRSAAR